MAYIESSHCISPVRDSSDKGSRGIMLEADALGIEFSFTEMLNDLEIPYEGIDFPCRPTSSHSKDNASGPSHECKANQVISELSSTTPEALSEKDMNIQGPDCLTAMKSVTKCIKILEAQTQADLLHLLAARYAFVHCYTTLQLP
ncbi:hypothetical protein SESBI_21309 [Sesbania bispinosa]|nr:hypothetical protein SESBI_21309 [Sesbania bispinosa]